MRSTLEHRCNRHIFQQRLMLIRHCKPWYSACQGEGRKFTPAAPTPEMGLAGRTLPPSAGATATHLSS